MRLLLLPISTRRALVYCAPPSHAVPNEKQTYLDKAVNKASKTWTEWEASETKWKLKVTYYGNNFLRRIPFEEWSLKSIPSRQKLAPGEVDKKVEVSYPGMFQGLQKESVLDILKRLSTDRQGLHKQRLIGSIIAMPFTIPVGLLPIIPNFPFLYLAFRAYSHWRALNGSKHLEHLSGASLLMPKAQGMLDSIYTAGLIYPTREALRQAAPPTDQETKKVVEVIRKQMHGSTSVPQEKAETPSPILVKGPVATTAEVSPSQSAAAVQPAQQEEEIMLLRGWSGRVLAEKLELPGLEIEIERAVEQVEKALKKEREIAVQAAKR